MLLRQEVKARAATQAAMWDRLLHVQPAFFRQHATGDLLARVMAITQLSHKLSGTTLRTIVSSGLALLKPQDRNPLHTTTYGTGELLMAVAEAGAKKIILGIGGSATNDGGIGCAHQSLSTLRSAPTLLMS